MRSIVGQLTLDNEEVLDQLLIVSSSRPSRTALNYLKSYQPPSPKHPKIDLIVIDMSGNSGSEYMMEFDYQKRQLTRVLFGE